MSTPRIDAFGNVMIGPSGAFRARIIQTSPTSYAIFPESGDPAEINFTDVPVKKGRTLKATLSDSGDEFIFQRASCGCQTPQHLRGPGRRFLALLEPAEV